MNDFFWLIVRLFAALTCIKSLDCKIVKWENTILCLTNLYLNDVFWAGWLGGLETLAKLWKFLILPDLRNNDRKRKMCINLLIQRHERQKSRKLSCIYLYLHCKANCSCSSWFSRALVEIVESWFWIFCFSSLISSFKELMVWEQIAAVSQRKIRDMTRV